jgi:uncharacterized membrane protein YhaH (DUF805 family)
MVSASDVPPLPSTPPAEPEDDLRTLLFGLAGRLPRKAFWLYGVVALSIAQLLAYLLLGIAGVKDTAADVASTLLIAWPSFAITVKRWHDRGKSAWWVLINLVPVVGLLWTLIECGFLRGTAGPNRYGRDPLQGR